MNGGGEIVVHEATPLRGFGLTEDEDLHSRVTLQVDAGHMYLRRQERCGRSAPLPPWETDPEAGIVLPREALANLALAILPHLTGDELRRVAEAMPRVAGEWRSSGFDGDHLFRLDRGGYACRVYSRSDDWEAVTLIGEVGFVGLRATRHPTARAAQAACDARLEAAGVRLCGERVREDGT